MNNNSHGLLSVLCLAVLGVIGSPLAAQQVSPGGAAGAANAQSANHIDRTAYSADEVRVTTQTLADGTTITRKSLTKVYRDSQGRMRHEMFETQGQSGEPDNEPYIINIHDPVAGVGYSLNPRDHTAQRREYGSWTTSPGPHPVSGSANPAPERPPMPRPNVEYLGTQMIESLEAKGQRVTRIIPEGVEGNDRPMKITTETWVSVKGRIVLVSISSDPRRGETETRLTNLSLEEPPAELFQVTADYTVRELQPVSKPEAPSD